MLTVISGLNWGDEGKGRMVDLMAHHSDVVVRYQGGNNAGHTVVTGQRKFVFNLLPSGILHSNVTCILGDGMVIDPEHLSGELQHMKNKVTSYKTCATCYNNIHFLLHPLRYFLL